ncbi:MAG: hypothetical protein F6K16_31735, partial [Symploca sp. SIO2B6]|nr:hypothetical protein [Symploca sp. SIO2B6]
MDRWEVIFNSHLDVSAFGGNDRQQLRDDFRILYEDSLTGPILWEELVTLVTSSSNNHQVMRVLPGRNIRGYRLAIDSNGNTLADTNGNLLDDPSGNPLELTSADANNPDRQAAYAQAQPHVVLDINYLSQRYYVTSEGTVQQFDSATALMHEAIHAIRGIPDVAAFGLSVNSSDYLAGLQGPVVTLTNQIRREIDQNRLGQGLGPTYPDRAGYLATGDQSTFSHTINGAPVIDYTPNHNADVAVVRAGFFSPPTTDSNGNPIAQNDLIIGDFSNTHV